MDVCIDTNAIEDGIESISNIIARLEVIVNFMVNRLEGAGSEFTSINYERASVNVSLAQDSLNAMTNKLEISKKYLNKLIDVIEQYNKYKF